MPDSITTNNNSIIQIQRGELEIHLLGTAHISSESVEEVRRAVQEIKPDFVLIELDENRYKSLKSGIKWGELNIREVIRKKQMSSLISNLVLGSYQKRMGEQTGVRPGSELLAAAESAQQNAIPFKLIDRDVKITLKRVWRGTSFFKKAHLIGALFASLFDRTEISEEELTRIKEKDTLSNLIDEMEAELPSLKHLLIDERDQYMASHVMEFTKGKVLAVVGAGHCPGMKKLIEANATINRNELDVIPPASKVGKLLPWIFLGFILLGFGALAFKDLDQFKASIVVWILVNGIPASIGALLALSHPLVIIVAFIAAPITSLNPMIGAGMVTGFLQAYLMPPTVAELENASNEMQSFKKWFSNRFFKIILAFILPSIGSAIGSWLGFADILSRIF